MRIQSINNKTNFSGMKVSSAKVICNNLTENYDIYKVTERDRKFLENLYTNTKLECLYDNLTEYQYFIWDHIMERGLTEPITSKTKTFVLADSGKNPCGVMRYHDSKLKNKLQYISTWPVEKNEKKLLAGKTLIMEMFRQLMPKSKDSTAELVALKMSAFNPIQTYVQTGFKRTGKSTAYTDSMRISHTNMERMYKKYSDIIKFTPCEERVEVNLFDELNING